jgi:hypothetical protein
VTARAGHTSRTKLEAAACDAMARRKVPHEHRSLRFRVLDETGGHAKYSPAIVARRGAILFLVEPLGTPSRAVLGRLTRFLEQHSPEIVLVVIAHDAKVSKIPIEAYDEIYPESRLADLVQRIRDQDPEGLIPPFEKARPAG